MMRTSPSWSANCPRAARISRTRWAAHNVRLHRTGVKHLHHPVVGDLELTYEGLELPSDPGLTLFAYTAEPGTPSEDGLKLLASWAATLELEDPVQPRGETRVRPVQLRRVTLRSPSDRPDHRAHSSCSIDAKWIERVIVKPALNENVVLI